MAGLSIISMPAGMMPGTDDRRDRRAGFFVRCEADEQRARRFRLRQDAHGDFGDDAQQPFRSREDAEQVVPFRVEVLAADAQRPRRSMVTSSTPSTLLVVRPYFRQCTPPEFSAMLPPMVQAIWLEGSGA